MGPHTVGSCRTQTAADWPSHRYKEIVNADGIPSEEIVDLQLARQDPPERIVRGDAFPQDEESLQPVAFRRGVVRNLLPAIGARQNGADGETAVELGEVVPAHGSEPERRRGYVLKFDEAFSRLFLMESHAVSNPVFSCCPAASPAARISRSFLYAASRSTRASSCMTPA